MIDYIILFIVIEKQQKILWSCHCTPCYSTEFCISVAHKLLSLHKCQIQTVISGSSADDGLLANACPHSGCHFLEPQQTLKCDVCRQTRVRALKMLNDIQVYAFFYLTPKSRARDDNRFSYVVTFHVGFVDKTGTIVHNAFSI